MRAPRSGCCPPRSRGRRAGTGLSLPTGKSSPDPVGFAKLDGLWRASAGKADGLTVRIARAGPRSRAWCTVAAAVSDAAAMRGTRPATLS